MCHKRLARLPVDFSRSIATLAYVVQRELADVTRGPRGVTLGHDTRDSPLAETIPRDGYPGAADPDQLP